MKTTISKSLALLVLVAGVLAATGFAETVRVTGAVTPAAVASGSTVFIHSSVENLTATNQAVTVTLTVNNPGECVSGAATNVGALALGLSPNETRLATLSVSVPTSACSGPYTVTITVKNSTGTVLATHTATFTVTIPVP
jgi:uncharacterized membrane protein